MHALYQKVNVNGQVFNNRVFMAPLTRNRAWSDGRIKKQAAEYYSQRASTGLIISEATQICPLGKGYIDTPGIYTKEHVRAWQNVTETVHQNGGKIFAQLWHVGRISNTELLPYGESPVAPSAIQAKDAFTFTRTGLTPVSKPRALTINEVAEIPNLYAVAARNALTAGFDGVEIHAANGYLLNQFISPNSNVRSDKYGGSYVARTRLLREVSEAVIQEIGAEKTAVRISPIGTFNDIDDFEAHLSYPYLAEYFSSLDLAYLHVIEGFRQEVTPLQKDLITQIRETFQGRYVANGAYSRERAEKAVDHGCFAVAFGKAFISNPDLPFRLAKGCPLARWDESTFYGGEDHGYTDYPSLKE